eukprot:6476875-Amphidinium_carterae.1
MASVADKAADGAMATATGADMGLAKCHRARHDFGSLAAVTITVPRKGPPNRIFKLKSVSHAQHYAEAEPPAVGAQERAWCTLLSHMQRWRPGGAQSC